MSFISKVVPASFFLILVSFSLPVHASSGFQIAERQGSRTLTADQDSKDVQYTGSIQKKVKALPKKRVEEVPVPILYGVTRANITPDFGAPRDGGARTHQGQDIFAPLGTPIVSPTDAIVTRTGKGPTAGIYVYTANPGGEAFNYMHLDRIAKGVKKGTVLKKGDLIGFVGKTGNAASTPAHLHFEIRKGRKALDPYPRLTGTFTAAEVRRSRLATIESIKKII